MCKYISSYFFQSVCSSYSAQKEEDFFFSSWAIETHNNIRTVQSESYSVKLTRFEIEGWMELIVTPSVNILHQSNCAWPCCLSSQCSHLQKLRKQIARGNQQSRWPNQMAIITT